MGITKSTFEDYKKIENIRDKLVLIRSEIDDLIENIPNDTPQKYLWMKEIDYYLNGKILQINNWLIAIEKNIK